MLVAHTFPDYNSIPLSYVPFIAIGSFLIVHVLLRLLTACCRTSHKGSILSDTEILRELNGDVVIYPFYPTQLGPNSYDVTLGDHYYKPQVGTLPEFFHPENGIQTIQYWGVTKGKNYGAHTASVVASKRMAERLGVSLGAKYIIIPPGHVILAHTNEFIGGRNHITTSLHSRSTMGRSCISICKCSGFGDIGYWNRYTLEIENHGLVPAVLTVGQRVGQIAFHRTGDVTTSYEKRGQYQGCDTIQEVVKTWTPLCMIPGNAAKLIKGSSIINHLDDEHHEPGTVSGPDSVDDSGED
jgi:dCTP deaminase